MERDADFPSNTTTFLKNKMVLKTNKQNEDLHDLNDVVLFYH